MKRVFLFFLSFSFLTQLSLCHAMATSPAAEAPCHETQQEQSLFLCCDDIAALPNISHPEKTHTTEHPGWKRNPRVTNFSSKTPSLYYFSHTKPQYLPPPETFFLSDWNTVKLIV